MAQWEPLLERVARERYPRLVAQAMLLVTSRADAEDLVQEALISTFSGRARFGSVEQAEAYVRRAMASRAVDAGRRRSAERRAADRVASTVTEAVVETPVPGFGPTVEAALAGLSPQVRACVVLRHMDDLSVRQTAQVLRVSEGAVKRYVSDGVAALNAALGTTGPHGDWIRVAQEGDGRG